LLRLNPQLHQIRELKEGTPIVVPDEFALAADESFTPSRALTKALLQQARDAVSRLRTVVKERVERSAEETDRLQTWLKSAQAKEFVRQSPELKESFSSAATAAKTLAKEQAEALSAQESALGKIKSQLAAFRVK
jgi:maltose-binding protein MalE